MYRSRFATASHVFACRMGAQHSLDVRMVQDRLDGKAALICGSVAYDTILQFQDRFKSHILPDRIHILNVSVLVPDMRSEFGGCAANIAYSLKLLGDRGVPMATAGHDFAPYAKRMVAQGIPLDHIKVVDETFTAQAFITTDLDRKSTRLNSSHTSISYPVFSFKQKTLYTPP